jgi:hypothetical protein
MDVRAFGGSYYGQTAMLPYTSGFYISPSGTNATFAACRAIYVENNSRTSDKTLTVVLSDSKAPITFNSIRDNGVIPISIVQISGTSTVDSCIVLY